MSLGKKKDGATAAQFERMDAEFSPGLPCSILSHVFSHMKLHKDECVSIKYYQNNIPKEVAVEIIVEKVLLEASREVEKPVSVLCSEILEGCGDDPTKESQLRAWAVEYLRTKLER